MSARSKKSRKKAAAERARNLPAKQVAPTSEAGNSTDLLAIDDSRDVFLDDGQEVDASPPEVPDIPSNEPAAPHSDVSEEATTASEPETTTEQPARPFARTPRPRRGTRTPRVTTPKWKLGETVLAFHDVTKRYGTTIAVDEVSLDVRAGSFFGVVGPNGSGKTTLLSMATGMVRPSSGTIEVHGVDVWRKPVDAKRQMGVLPDRLRLFDQLTGAQMLHYAGLLHGLGDEAARERAKDLIEAFDLHEAASRLVADYSTGMTKKVALAAAMLHAPRVLILDEPFEAVDPVSAAALEKILQKYVTSGGTVILSSHSMELVQRLCDQVAIIVRGRMLAHGPVDEVRGRGTLEQKFHELAGGRQLTEGMEWLSSFSD